MKTFTIKSNGKRFFAENNETFDYENIESLESVSTMDLHKILTDRVNRDILEDLKIIDNKGQNILFEVSEEGNLILRCENEEKEINSSTLEITVTTLYGDSREIKRFDSNDKMLSKEVINNKDNSRKYTEFHKKSGNIELEMQAGNDGKQNYTLTRYDNKNNIKETKTFSEENSDFETIKNDNTLGHKRKFALGREFHSEKVSKEFGVPINIGYKEDPEIIEKEIESAICKRFGYSSYDELYNDFEDNKIDYNTFKKIYNFQKVFLKAKEIEFLKKKLSNLEKANLFDNPEKEFDDKNKLGVCCIDEKSGKMKLTCGGIPLKPNKQYLFTIPDKDGNVYIFDSQNEHHSYFKWNKEKNPNYSVNGAGTFKTDDDCDIKGINNDSGHFQPLAKDSNMSLLRKIDKIMYEFLLENGMDTKNIDVTEVLSKTKKIDGVGYDIFGDVTEEGGGIRNGAVNTNQKESGFTTVISERKLKLIRENTIRSLNSHSLNRS